MQLGLALKNLHAPLCGDANEPRRGLSHQRPHRLGPPTEPKKSLPFPEMEIERDAADEVKRDVPILVILGNPPYNGYAGIAMAEERELTDAYRTTSARPRRRARA